MTETSTNIHHGDCLAVMKGMGSSSVDAVVTDPPAGISFMGKEWDNPDHFPLRDRGERLTGSGNPTESRGFANGVTFDKSTKGRDTFIEFLAERMTEARRLSKPGSYALVWALPRTSHWTALALEESGWVIRDRISHLFGTGFPKGKACLKPGCEDYWLAVNPAKKVTPLNIDGCRINPGEVFPGRGNGKGNYKYGDVENYTSDPPKVEEHNLGRWPANVTHDGSPEVMEAFALAGEKGGGFGVRGASTKIYGGDSGTAARFFYCSKASRSDRGEGNTHPTVKSTTLMRWLCRLITPPGGIVLDPFMGSGSTGLAARAEGFSFIGIEEHPEYFAIVQNRLRGAEA